MSIEPTTLSRALKEPPPVEKDIPDKEDVEAANELHGWLNKPVA